MPKVKRNLRPLLRFLTLTGTPAQNALLEGISAMADAFRSGRQVPLADVPTSLIPERHRRYIVNSNGKLVRDRLEFLIYRHRTFERRIVAAGVWRAVRSNIARVARLCDFVIGTDVSTSIIFCDASRF